MTVTGENNYTNTIYHIGMDSEIKINKNFMRLGRYARAGKDHIKDVITGDIFGEYRGDLTGLKYGYIFEDKDGFIRFQETSKSLFDQHVIHRMGKGRDFKRWCRKNSSS